MVCVELLSTWEMTELILSCDSVRILALSHWAAALLEEEVLPPPADWVTAVVTWEPPAPVEAPVELCLPCACNESSTSMFIPNRFFTVWCNVHVGLKARFRL